MKYNKQIYLGRDRDGKLIRKWIHAETKTELKNKIEQYKREMEKVENPSDITFEKYSQKWLTVSKGTKSKQTQDAARTHLRKCSALDPYPIRKITRSQCQSIVNECWDHPHAAKGVADILRQIFTMAQSDGIIASNPAVRLDRPKILRPKHHLLTERELDAVKNADLSDQDRLLVTILMTFGLRPAEALALSPTDFDLNAKILHIDKAIEMTNDNKSRIKSTKTGEIRDIPIPDALILYFKEQFHGRRSFLLFQKSTGGMHTKSSYKRTQERVWKKVNEALGGSDELNLVEGRSFYDFRHYRATIWYYLCQQGIISPKLASKMLGHSEVIFLSTYSHLDMKHEQIDKLYPDFDAVNL